MLGISKEQIIDMPLAEFKGRIILVDNAVDCRKALKFLSRQQILGFDTETRPSFRKGVYNKAALLQLSTYDECFLFRLNRIGLTKGLKNLFENSDITKVGLSIRDDLHQLSKFEEFVPANIIELQSYVKDYDIADNALQKVYAIIFGKKISKGQRLSNWEAEHLTEAQKAYAALDAYACLNIYTFLSNGGFNPAESPFIIPDTDDNMIPT